VKFTVTSDDGEPVEFECADTFVSRWVCGAILEGDTYPVLPIVDGVEIVCDVGANCGAASVYFARHYPDAVVHAFEPASEPLAYLLRNAASYTNIRVHTFGLHSHDHAAELFKGDGDSILGSIVRRDVNLDESEPVTLRDAGAWATQHQIAHIDILKVDVELCELDVLDGFANLLPSVKVLYIEYGSRSMRREIQRRLALSHVLYAGDLFLDQGECIYVRRDISTRTPAPALRQRDDWSPVPALPFVDEEVMQLTAETAASDLAAAAVVFAQTKSGDDFDRIDTQLAPTHELYLGTVHPEGASCTYLRADLAGLDTAQEHLRTMVRARWTQDASAS
jgi:FkbM family methyltransferase